MFTCWLSCACFCAVTVNISGVNPTYEALSQGDVDLTTSPPLFRPVVQVFGKRVAELDGTPITADEYDESNQQRKNYVTKYYIPDLTAGDKFSFPLAGDLDEGYYNISAKIFQITDYPELMGIGKTPIIQSDVEEVNNKTEIMGKSIYNGLVGVQQTSTPYLSEISSDKENVAITVRRNTRLVLHQCSSTSEPLALCAL